METTIKKIIEHNLEKGRIPCVIDDRFLWITKDNVDLIYYIKEPVLTLRYLEHDLFKDISSLKDKKLQYFSYYNNEKSVVEIGLQDVDDFILTDIKQFEDRIKPLGLLDEFIEWSKTYEGGYDNTFSKFLVDKTGYTYILCLQDYGEPLFQVTVYDTLENLKHKPIFKKYLNKYMEYYLVDEEVEKVKMWMEDKAECPLEPHDVVVMDDVNFELVINHAFYENKIL